MANILKIDGLCCSHPSQSTFFTNKEEREKKKREKQGKGERGRVPDL